MNRSLAPAAVLWLASLMPNAAFAQNAHAPQPLPKDPVTLLQLAWQQNGLHGSDLQPWHLRATWTEVNQKGQATDAGVWEEWWAGDTKYKISYRAGNLRQDLFVTDHGSFVSGSPDAPNWNFSLVQAMVTNPMPNPEQIRSSKWSMTYQKYGGIENTCAEEKGADEYCFANGLPILRIYRDPVAAIGIDSPVLFQGRYVARQIRILQRGLPEIDIAVGQIDPIRVVDAADFMPPHDAVAANSNLTAEGVRDATPVRGNIWEYWKAQEETGAWKFRALGSVVWIDAVIKNDGTSSDLHAMTGLAIFQESALKMVRTWRFKPYLVDGKPIDIRVRICIVYRQ